MVSDGDDAGFCRMLEMPVATTSPGQIPAIMLNQLDRFADLHARMLYEERGPSTRGSHIAPLLTSWSAMSVPTPARSAMCVVMKHVYPTSPIKATFT